MDIVTYYKLVHRMVSSEKYSLTEIYMMLPYERDIFFAMLIDDAEKERQEMEKTSK